MVTLVGKLENGKLLYFLKDSESDVRRVGRGLKTLSSVAFGYLVHDNGVDTFVSLDKTVTSQFASSDKMGKFQAPSGIKNPFKPLHFEFTCEVEDFETNIAAICNFLLPGNCQYKVYIPCLIERIFNPALWCSSFLYNMLRGMKPRMCMGGSALFLDEKQIRWSRLPAYEYRTYLSRFENC